MSLWFKRLLLVVLSIGGGIGGLLLIWTILNGVYQAGVNLDRYGFSYAIFTALPIALFCAIWLDYFLDTGLLGPDRQVKNN